MADHSATKNRFPVEPRSDGALFAQFIAMSGRLTHLTELSRLLRGNDEEHDVVLAEAVRTARKDTLSSCKDLLLAQPHDLRDRRLQTVVRIVTVAIGSDDPEKMSMMRNVLAVREGTQIFQLRVTGEPQFNVVLEYALKTLDAYMALPGTQSERFEGCRSPDVMAAYTPIATRFVAMLRKMETYIAAEKAMQRAEAGDVLGPDFTRAMTQAECALIALTEEMKQLMATTIHRAEDRKMWEMAGILHNLLMHDDQGRWKLFNMITEHPALLEASGTRPIARRCRHLQAAFQRLCASLMELEDFGGTDPDDWSGPRLVA